MIEIIGDLIRYIVILIFLATLLEMMLPHGQFRRYLRMLVGILLILTILSPIQNIMRLAPGWEVPVFLAAPSSKEELELIMQRGEQMREETYENAVTNYRYKIFTVVEGIIQREFSRELCELKVTLDEDPQSMEFGSIKKMVIKVGANIPSEKETGSVAGASNIVIEEIEITVKRESSEAKLEQKKEKEKDLPAASDEEVAIKNYITRYFLLKEEQVDVYMCDDCI